MMDRRWAAKTCNRILVGTLVFSGLFAVLPGYALDLNFRLWLAGAQICLAVAGGLFAWPGADAAGQQQIMSRAAGLLLATYLVHLLSLLFFDGTFGREMAFSWDNLFYRTNFEPFHTISSYLRGWRNGNVPTRLMIINLLGNLLALAPLGILLPMVFRPMKNLLLCLLAGAVFIVFIEATQLFTGTGSCDVDDFILNFAGLATARIAWGIGHWCLSRRKQRVTQ